MNDIDRDSLLRILFITDNFPPETNAPASRTHEHAQRWVASGADVTVITCAPNFPQGKVYEGYRNAWRTVESIDGIRVVRVKTFITGNEGFLLRIADYLSFMFSAFFFGLFEKRPDVIVGTSPQFFAAAGGWLLSIAKWRPFIFELRDLWPASIVTVGAMKDGMAIRFLEWLELFLYRRARMIVSVTESFKDDLVMRGIAAEKIEIVRNGVDLQRYSPRPPNRTMAEAWGVGSKFVVGYLGTHGMAHALDNVIRCAQRLRSIPEIVFLLVGDGAQKRMLVDCCREQQVDNVVFHDPVPKSQMPDLWSICDIALVHLRNDPVFSTVIPSKLFEAFGTGKPVLIAQPDGEAAAIVRAEGAGEWVPPESPEALAGAVAKLFRDRDLTDNYAANSSRAARKYSRDAAAAGMLQLLHEAADKGP